MTARADMLARLVALRLADKPAAQDKLPFGQAAQDHAGRSPEIVTLRALVEEASELGAARALERLGLDDAKAKDDMAELRELLGAWRDAKKSAWKAAIEWLVRGLLALLLVGIALRLGVGEMLR